MADTKQIIIAVVAVVALSYGAVNIFRGGKVKPGKAATEMHQQTGSVLAELASKAAGDNGSILLLVPDETSADPRRAAWMKDQIAGFENNLGGAKIAARETVAVMISRTATGGPRPVQFTLELYRDLLKRHPTVTAVASFVGEPDPAGAALKPGEKITPLVSFSPNGQHVPALMNAGLLSAAIVPRTKPTPLSEAGGNWFDAMYETVTPETLAAWTSSLSPAR